jgi:hypothetical protein
MLVPWLVLPPCSRVEVGIINLELKTQKTEQQPDLPLSSLVFHLASSWSASSCYTRREGFE